MSTAPGAKPSVSMDSEEARRPTGSDWEARRFAASISDGVASPVGSWETELTDRPQAEQYRPLSETSAEQEGHFIVTIVIPSTLPLPEGEGESGLRRNLGQRLLRFGEQSFGADGGAGRVLHPHVGGDVAHLRHLLELGADRARLLNLSVDLKSDHVAEWVVRQVEKRVDHMRVDREKRDVLLLEDRRVVAVPDVARDSQRGLLQLPRRGVRVLMHPVPDPHVHERDAGDLEGAPEVVQDRQRAALRVGLREPEQLQISGLKDEGEGLGKGGIGDAREQSVVDSV